MKENCQYCSIRTPDDIVSGGEVVEHLGGEALLEEVHHWGQAVSVHSLASLPGLSA